MTEAMPPSTPVTRTPIPSEGAPEFATGAPGISPGAPALSPGTPGPSSGVPVADSAFADLFDPPGEHWQRLSPSYVRLRRLMVVLVWGCWAALAVVVTGLAWHWWAAGELAAVAVCWIAYRYWRMGPIVAAWGYAERDTDLYVRHGIWQRRLVAVPYGRMQMVEVNSGPIERRFGLATVRLVTASAGTNAEIPGLPAEDAAVLRDRLAERGEHQSMGL